MRLKNVSKKSLTPNKFFHTQKKHESYDIYGELGGSFSFNRFNDPYYVFVKSFSAPKILISFEKKKNTEKYLSM